MPIKLKCTCGQSLTVPDSLAGKTGKCPKCQTAIKIPALATPAAASASPATAKPATAKPTAAKPTAAKPTAASAVKAVTAPAMASTLDDFFDEAGLTKKTGPTCPKCGQAVQRNIVLCTHCGFNLQTGEQAVGFNAQAQKAEFDNMYLQEAASNMQREVVSEGRHAKAGFPWWMLVSFLLGSICLGAAGIVIVDATMNEPEPEGTFLGNLQREHFGVVAGVTFTAVGSLIGFFAHLSIVVFAFQQTLGQGFSTLFIPFYNFYYAIKTWADNKAGVFGLILGGVILGLGVFLTNHYGGVRGYYF